jgi:hypothetical protein
MHGRRSPGKLDEQTPPGGVSDRCQICTIVRRSRRVLVRPPRELRPCASACAHFRAGWQYINVRRLFMMIKESIDVST